MTRRIVVTLVTIGAVITFTYVYDATIVRQHHARCALPSLMEPSC